jgi:hypothetical protein
MSQKLKLVISEHGGEHTIGYMDEKIALYWLENHERDAFENCLFDSEKLDCNIDAWRHIPEEFMLPVYHYEYDQVLHIIAQLFIEENQISVLASGGRNVDAFHEEIGEFKLNDDIFCNIEHPKDVEIPPNKRKVYTQAIDKAYWETEAFEVADTFDVNKLQINAVLWADVKLIRSIKYDGKELEIELESSRPKSEQAWIDNIDM